MIRIVLVLFLLQILGGCRSAPIASRSPARTHLPNEFSNVPRGEPYRDFAVLKVRSRNTGHGLHGLFVEVYVGDSYTEFTGIATTLIPAPKGTDVVFSIYGAIVPFFGSTSDPETLGFRRVENGSFLKEIPVPEGVQVHKVYYCDGTTHRAIPIRQWVPELDRPYVVPKVFEQEAEQ